MKFKVVSVKNDTASEYDRRSGSFVKGFGQKVAPGKAQPIGSLSVKDLDAIPKGSKNWTPDGC